MGETRAGMVDAVLDRARNRIPMSRQTMTEIGDRRTRDQIKVALTLPGEQKRPLAAHEQGRVFSHGKGVDRGRLMPAGQFDDLMFHDLAHISLRVLPSSLTLTSRSWGCARMA